MNAAILGNRCRPPVAMRMEENMSLAALHARPHAARQRLARFLLATLLIAGVMPPAQAADTLQVQRITPEGDDVPPGRQLVIQFDRDVVALGNLRPASVPVTITPALACEWRWLNASALACNLGEQEAMKPATRYRVTVNPGLVTTRGETQRVPFDSSFSTRRPQLFDAAVAFWLTPQQPVLRLAFSDPVTKSSLGKALALYDRPGSARAAFDLLPESWLRQQPDWQRWFATPTGESDDETAALPPDDVIALPKGDEARRTWLLLPRKELRAASAAHLELLAGVATPLGPELSSEQRTALRIDTLAPFRFLGIRCLPNAPDMAANDYVNVDAAQLGEGNSSVQCDPMSPVWLRFSSPVLASQVKDGVNFAPRLDGGRSDYDPWANSRDWTQRHYAWREGAEFTVMLPELLRAAQDYRVAFAAVQDEFGRKLPATPPVLFRTAHRDPRLVIDYQDIVLEKGVDSVAAGYTNNLDRLDYRGTRLYANGNSAQVLKTQKLANIQDISYRFALMVREILDGKSGAAWLCVTPTPALPGTSRPDCLFAQVTPFHVHAKMGHFSSLAWVTDLASGAPVANARVEILRGRREALEALQPLGAQKLAAPVNTDALGVAALPGVATLDPNLERLPWHYSGSEEDGFFLRVTAGDDIALLPLDSEFRAWAGGDVWPDARRAGEHAHAWGFTAQGVHRAGDTVDMKLFLRDQQDRHWITPALRSGYTLTVSGPTGSEVYRREGVALDAFGAVAASFLMPKEAVGGWYDVKLRLGENREWLPLRFLVSDFTPSPFRVETALNADLFQPGDNVGVTTQATLFSGGPYTQAEVRVRALVEALPFAPATPATRGFHFGNRDEDKSRAVALADVQGFLDGDGRHAAQFTPADNGIYHGRLRIEASVSDDRGKSVVREAVATWAARDRYVGVRPRSWVYNAGQRGAVDVIVSDARGVLVAGAAVRGVLQKRVVHSARVQGPGNAYLLRNTGDWEDAGTCEADSRADGAVACEFTPEKPGDYRLQLTVPDTQGREFTTVENIWAVGAGSVNWAMDNDTGLEIVAEAERVDVGRNARYLVKNPYPGATALVTVERYGVLQRRVLKFNDATALLEIPVTAEMAPGYFLSVVVASPRVAKPLEGEVDLGKPAFRMGYVKTAVNAPGKRVQLTITPARSDYRPREEIVAKLRAVLPETARGRPLSVALLAVDESVLALNSAGTGHYNAVEAFDRLDDLDVFNWNLVSRLVGRQKIEKKGANPGGDGGAAAMAALRDNFRFVALWRGDVPLNARGEAEVRFTAPDNLTGWRLIAVAATPEDHFGLGEARVQVNKPTEIRAATPNQLSEGDRFSARFAVFNRTDRARTLTVRVDASGAALATVTQTLALAPRAQGYVELPVVTDRSGELRFRVTAGDAVDRDTLAHNVNVLTRRVREVAASHGSSDGERAVEAIALPADAYPDSSQLTLVLSPTVLGNLDGTYRYVVDYPYECWEQRLSRAVMLAATKPLTPWLQSPPAAADADARVRAVLTAAGSFQAPNGGMAFWQARDEYVSPYLSAYTALAFRWLARGGYAVPRDVETKLHDYLRNLLRRELPGDGSGRIDLRSEAANVRAVALAALSDAGAVDAAEVQRHAAQMPRMRLFGKAHYLQALANTRAPAAELKKTADAILALSEQSAGKLRFSEPEAAEDARLLASPARDNCAALSALVRLRTLPDMAATLGDLAPKLARSIVAARGKRTHFENTQENVFCMNALYSYARAYEGTAPVLEASARYEVSAAENLPVPASRALGSARFASVRDAAKTLRLPLAAGDAGRRGALIIERSGQGRLYYGTQLAFASKSAETQAANAGFEIHREHAVEREGRWQLLRGGETLRRGERVRVDLFVSTPAARDYVVVDDPVPGLLEPVNAALAGNSRLDDVAAALPRDAQSRWFSGGARWQEFGDWNGGFYHRELGHAAVRYYADTLAPGRHYLSWIGQVIATGEFSAAAPQASEMYDADIYGRALPAKLQAAERE
jgi:uncharacterized protein YfaS (alpha-2-macroglobulin family)